jgi:hypothetical protein
MGIVSLYGVAACVGRDFGKGDKGERVGWGSPEPRANYNGLSARRPMCPGNVVVGPDGSSLRGKAMHIPYAGMEKRHAIQQP